MKKCISILVAVLLFINSGGFIIIFYQVQKHAKEEMITSIRKGNLDVEGAVQFRITKADLNKNVNGFIWKDKNEFEYKDRLYDIVSISEENDSLIIFCINDLAEERIIKTFNDEVNALACGKLNNSKTKTSLINLISQALLRNTSGVSNSENPQEIYPDFVENILLNEIEIPSPPPKLT
jgi:hypothetical protein